MFVYLNNQEPLEAAFNFKPSKGSFTEVFLDIYKENLLGLTGTDLVRKFLGFSIDRIWFDTKDIKRLVVSTYRDVPCDKDEHSSSHNLELLIVYNPKEKIFILSEPEYYFDTTDDTNKLNGKPVEDEILEESYLKFKEEWDKLTSEQVYNKLKECLLPVKDKDLTYKEINELRNCVVEKVEEKLKNYIKSSKAKDNVANYFQDCLDNGLRLFSVEYFPVNDRTSNETVLITINGLRETEDLDCYQERYDITKEVSRELSSGLQYIQRVIVCL